MPNSDWLTFSNSAQCAADQSKPTSSFFVAATLRDYSIVLSNTADALNAPKKDFVSLGNYEFRKKLVRISNAVITGLLQKDLPYIDKNDSAAIKAHWLGRKNKRASQPLVYCQQVNQINGYYSNLFVRGLQASTLEHLARELSNPAKSPVNCDESNIKPNADFYPVFNFEIPTQLWKSVESDGFLFWASYKIYLSWAWRNDTDDRPNVYTNLMKTLPIEEQVVLMPNGCKSLSKPECSSDFLSSAELKTLLSSDRTFNELSNSSLNMRDHLLENNDKIDFSIQNRLAGEAENNEWVRSFQKSYLAFSQAQQEKLFRANKLMSSLLSQKSEQRFVDDLKLSFNQKDQTDQLFYLCSEYRLLSVEKPISLFKTDHEFLKKEGHRLNRFMSYGLTVGEMIELFERLSPQLEKSCEDFDKSSRPEGEAISQLINFKPWYQQYLSRYKIFKQEITQQQKDQRAQAPTLSQPADLTQGYLPQLCATVIDCARELLEGVVYINKSLLHSKTLFRDEIPLVPLFSERSEKVACGLYDPWEVSKLNRKKLITDIGTSLLFGWTSVPIYLDINYKPKELVSLNKLIENGQIKFDTQFKSGEIQKTLSLNLGSLINVPCSVQISQVSQNEPKQPLIFNGISVGVCKGSKFSEMTPIDKKIDTFKKTPKTDITACGQCSLSFSQASTFAHSSAFSPIRFFVRLAESVLRYKKVQNDDLLNPRQFNINKESLLKAYTKFENSIPESCVPLLTRGLPCLGNICESITAREFELKSGLKVKEVSLVPDHDQMPDQYTAYIKTDSCSTEMSVGVRCSSDGDNYFMAYYPRLAKSCQKRETP